MKLYITLTILFTIPIVLNAQVIQGRVESKKHEALVGATVRIINTTKGTTTDVNGHFQLDVSDSEKKLVISFIGYKTDTFNIKTVGDHFHYQLAEDNELLQEVVVKSSTTFYDEVNPIQNEVILEKELLKAACCDLSESFETNASVDVSFSDAVTGSKIIRLLGLDGRYVQLNRENVPHIRGLTARFGLNFVPGTWLQSIDVGKGAGSVVNGFESMTGQINLQFKKPENSEKVYLNAYANSFGRLELNFNHATKLSEKWSAAFLTHADYFNNEIDRNDDGFLDLPRSRQINFLNRYKYEGDKLVSQIGFHVMRNERAGGQSGFRFGDDHLTSSEFGYSNGITRFEIFGKTGLLFPRKPYKGWGFIYSAAFQDIEAGFGRRAYSGDQTTLYGNLIYQNIIGDTRHQYKTGVSVLSDLYDEQFVDSTFSRNEIVPGIYGEYTFLPDDQFTAVIGGRVDFHNLFGTYWTPRVHLRYQFKNETVLRAAVGRGYRTPNAIAENFRVLVSSRDLIFDDELEPEVSWNSGASLTTKLPIGDKSINLAFDYFYTFFENQLVVDQDRDSDQVNFNNLDGRSFAHSFQVEGSYELNQFWNIKAAYKYYDVQTTLNDQLQRVPFISRQRFFLNTVYATRFDKWKADATLQWFGRKRLPNSADRPTEFQQDGFSPDYFLVNAQISRGFKWGSIYLGSENLLDFRQDDPILDPQNPFGDNFDGSIVWGPIPGRLIYAGFRYKIK